jgi:hypothetical protein
MSVCLRQSLWTLAAVLALGLPAAGQQPVPVPPAAVRPAPLPPPPADVPPPVVDMTPADPPGRPVPEILPGRCDCSSAWLGSAEYLLVRPRRRANDFALVDPVDNLTPEGSIKSVNDDLTSGVRAGIGYRLAGSAWESWFTYTYLHSGGDRAVFAPPGGVIYPTLTRPGLVDNVLAAAAGTSLTYNLYDLESYRRVVVDESLALRLGFGIRFATIDQGLNAFYFGGDANGTQVRSRVNFDGAGPMVGGEGQWLLPRGFRVFGRARGALVVGDICNHLDETDNGGLTVNANVREHFFQTVPVLEMATGVAWEYGNWRLAVGYEVVNWFNLIDSPTFINDVAEGKIGRRRGDLSLEGVFFQMGLAY